MRKIVNVFISVSLCMSAFYALASVQPIEIKASAVCTTVEECEAEKEKINQEKAEVQAKIDAAETDVSKQEEAIKAVQEKSTILETQVEVLNASIMALIEKETELTDEIKSTEDALLARYRVQQGEGSFNPFIQLLITSKSFTDLFKKWQIIARFNEDDSDIVKEITEKRAEIEKNQKLQEADKAEIETSKAELDASAGEMRILIGNLRETQKELIGKMKGLDLSESEIEKQKNAAQEYKDQLEKEEQNNANNGNSSGSDDGQGSDNGGDHDTGGGNGNNGGGTAPPTSPWVNPASRSGVTVTCDIGCYPGHIGIDFGLSYENVLAITRGKVIYTQGGCTEGDWNCGGGFGNMVAIYHYVDGTDYVTISAHLSQIWVSEGQTVGTGEAIGVSGHTGASTGPHLHLELVKGVSYYPSRYEREIYGVRVIDYLPGPFNYW